LISIISHTHTHTHTHTRARARARVRSRKLIAIQCALYYVTENVRIIRGSLNPLLMRFHKST